MVSQVPAWIPTALTPMMQLLLEGPHDSSERLSALLAATLVPPPSSTKPAAPPSHLDQTGAVEANHKLRHHVLGTYVAHSLGKLASAASPGRVKAAGVVTRALHLARRVLCRLAALDECATPCPFIHIFIISKFIASMLCIGLRLSCIRTDVQRSALSAYRAL